jgi:hypothetical protein
MSEITARSSAEMNAATFKVAERECATIARREAPRQRRRPSVRMTLEGGLPPTLPCRSRAGVEYVWG